MRRSLRYVLAALLLISAVGFMQLGKEKTFHGVAIWRRTPTSCVFVEFGRGLIGVTSQSITPGPPPGLRVVLDVKPGLGVLNMPVGLPPRWTAVSGAELEHHEWGWASLDEPGKYWWSSPRIPYTWHFRDLLLPTDTLSTICWWLFGLSVAPIAWRLVKKLTTWDPAFCRKCGYDLRASTDRCPECGTPISAEAKG